MSSTPTDSSRMHASGPWQRTPRRLPLWSLRGPGRRGWTRLTFNMGCVLLALVALGVYALEHRWIFAAAGALISLDLLFAGREKAAKQELEALSVPRGAKPARIIQWSPPGSSWHRIATRALRFHRAEWLTRWAIFLVLMAAFATDT